YCAIGAGPSQADCAGRTWAKYRESREAASETLPRNHTSFAFSTTRRTFHALVFESLRDAWISTRSPALHSLLSSCAWYLFDLITTLSYIGGLARRSTTTVTVL